MIYFDNAATTRNKPREVFDAFEYYITEIGVSPGRGSYSLGIEASRMLYKARMSTAQYFGLSDPNVVFTKNSTEAINMFLFGFLNKGDHVVISPYEHNAVLRPLEKLRQLGVVDYSVVSRDDLELPGADFAAKYFKDNTTLLAMTLASNLTGRIIFNPEFCEYSKKEGICTFVDTSQGAGKIRIDMMRDCVDYLAFTGHKDLKALPGVGGLCSVKELEFEPLIQGGTGVYGHEKTNPRVFPEGYEAGTLNMPAIWAFKAAIEYTEKNFEKNRKIETELSDYLTNRLRELDNVILYDDEYIRVDTIGFNIKGFSSNEVVQILDENKICTRGGIHCAILAHEALQTVKTGMVRVSLCETNTMREIDMLVDVIRTIGER